MRAALTLPSSLTSSPAPIPTPGQWQLTVGFAGPALAQLVFESSLFRRHCEERRRAGLPQETGLQASLYSCIAETWGALDTPLRLIALCLLLGALFDASLLLDAAMHGPAVS